MKTASSYFKSSLSNEAGQQIFWWSFISVILQKLLCVTGFKEIKQKQMHLKFTIFEAGKVSSTRPL